MKKKEYVDGGNRLTVALDFNPNQSIGYITGTAADLLNVNAQQNLIPAELDWKFMYSNFSITLKDLNATADSKHAIVSLVSQKAKNTLASVRQFLATSFYGSAANNPNAFNGMADIFAASGTSYAGLLDTDLGVDAVGDKKWLPQFDTTSTVCDYQTIEPMLTKLKTKASIEGNASRLGYMVSKAAVLSSFKQKQQMQQRFLPAKDLEVGFDGINVDGVVWYADELQRKLYICRANVRKSHLFPCQICGICRFQHSGHLHFCKACNNIVLVSPGKDRLRAYNSFACTCACHWHRGRRSAKVDKDRADNGSTL